MQGQELLKNGVENGSDHSEEELKKWAEKISGWLKQDIDVYAYFNNDAYGYALKNARQLREKVGAYR